MKCVEVFLEKWWHLMYLSKITNLVLSLCKLPQRLIGIAIIFGPFSIILCINLWPVAPFVFYFYSFCFFVFFYCPEIHCENRRNNGIGLNLL